MSEATWNDPRITAYVLGELSADEQAVFETELEENPELAAAVDEARNVTGQLAEFYAAETTPPLDAERRQAITPAQNAPAPNGSAPKGSANSRSWKLSLVGLATAATLLLIVGATALRPAFRSVLRVNPALEGQVRSDEEIFEYGQARAETDQLHEYSQQSAPAEFKRAMQRATDRGKSSVRRDEADSPADTPVAEESIAIGLDGNAGVPAEPSVANAAGGKVVTDNMTRRQAGAVSRAGAVDRFRGGRASLAIGPRKAGVAEQSEQENFRDLRKTTGPGRNVPMRGGGGFGDANDEGRGPGIAGDQFDPITDNAFRRVAEHPLSTFSVDVDTASYSKVRDYLLRSHQLPQPGAVRIEEMVNYFDYAYDPPAADSEHPFTAHAAVTSCPWNDDHRLARIAIKGQAINQDERPPCNLVFLLDTSGSMNAANKLPLVIDGMKMLLKQLDKKDRVAITVYAGSAGLVLDSTPAKKKKKIRRALTQLSAGGSTNGGAGIQLAFQTARDHFIAGGVNRVILCTDGDFNVGNTSTDALVEMVQREAKGGIFLSVLGFGMGNHNDAMLEKISGRGNGNYAFIDTEREARKVLVEQAAGTLVTIAKDVKLQIEFNPTQVSAYRLIGYENRVLAKADFNDDKKDAGEIGAGHQVTALYEIVPAGVEADAVRPKVDDLKYQAGTQLTDASDSNELMTLKLRYKQPDSDTSTLVQFPVTDDGSDFADADEDVRFAAAVAGFGMQLRRSEYKGSWTLSDVRAVAKSARGEDPHGLRSEFLQLVRRASDLMGQE